MERKHTHASGQRPNTHHPMTCAEAEMIPRLAVSCGWNAGAPALPGLLSGVRSPRCRQCLHGSWEFMMPLPSSYICPQQVISIENNIQEVRCVCSPHFGGSMSRVSVIYAYCTIWTGSVCNNNNSIGSQLLCQGLNIGQTGWGQGGQVHVGGRNLLGWALLPFGFCRHKHTYIEVTTRE